MNRVLIGLLLSLSLSISAEVVMRVDGLACAFCAYGLEKKLKSLKGVEEVKISLNEGKVWIRLKEGYRVDEDTLRKLVKESGFVVREITVR